MLLLARLLLHSFSCRLVSFESSLTDLVFNDQRKIKSWILFSILLLEELDNINVKRSVDYYKFLFGFRLLGDVFTN